MDRMIVYSWFCALLLILVNTDAMAEVDTDLYNKANKLYMDQAYQEAAEKYEELIAGGKVSAEVYYNLGNAYYKTGNFAASVLNYERAKKLRPSDPDIAYNLKMAYLNTIDKIEPVPLLFYEKWWDEFVNSGSVDGRAWWVIALLWVALGLTAVYLFSQRILVRKIMFYSMLIVLVAACFTWFLTYRQDRHMNQHQGAVIFAESEYVKSSPDQKSANLFMLHSGTRVDVMDELQGWKKIRIANGSEGWIPADAIEII